MIGDNLTKEWMLLGFISEIATSVWLAWVHDHCYHVGGHDMDPDFRYKYYKLKWACVFVVRIIFAGGVQTKGWLGLLPGGGVGRGQAGHAQVSNGCW